jgi:hypothetical protein
MRDRSRAWRDSEHLDRVSAAMLTATLKPARPSARPENYQFARHRQILNQLSAGLRKQIQRGGQTPLAEVFRHSQEPTTSHSSCGRWPEYNTCNISPARPQTKASRKARQTARQPKAPTMRPTREADRGSEINPANFLISPGHSQSTASGIFLTPTPGTAADNARLVL